MTKILSLKFAAAFVAALGVSNAVAAPKFVDVSKGRLEIGQNINFENYKSEGKIDKVNSLADGRASNAAVRQKLSCVQSALGCAAEILPPPPATCSTPPCDSTPPGDTDIGACTTPPCGTPLPPPDVVNNGGSNPPRPDIQGPAQLPNLSGLVSSDSAADLAAACVQDESFCKDANLKRVANRNSVIDEIFFYTEL